MTTPADLNLGPLTMTFTAPPACNSLTVAADTTSGYAPFVYPRLFSSIANSCFPSGYPLGNAAFTSTFGAYAYQDQHVYYSPGLCPSGWLSNAVDTSGVETTAFCCEPGFNPQTTPAVEEAGPVSSTFCISSVRSTVITTVAYTGDGQADGVSMTFTFTGDIVPAPAIWIRYKDSDFASSTMTMTSSSTSSASSSSSSSSSKSSASSESLSSTSQLSSPSIPQTTSSTNNPTSTPTSASVPPTGLSTGAKIGLGLGIPLGIILAAAIFAFILIKRRRREHFVAELSGEGVRPTSELPAGRDQEMKSSFGRSELDAGVATDWPILELEGSSGTAHGKQPHSNGEVQFVY